MRLSAFEVARLGGFICVWEVNLRCACDAFEMRLGCVLRCV